MPFKSEAQRRWMYAAEARGEVPKGMAERWEAHTPPGKLPARVKKKRHEKSAFWQGFEKRAEEPERRSRLPSAAAAAVGTYGASELARRPLIRGLGRLQDTLDRPSTRHDLRRLSATVRRARGLDTSVGYGSSYTAKLKGRRGPESARIPLSPQGGIFVPEKNHVHLGPKGSAATLAHELGHAANAKSLGRLSRVAARVGDAGMRGALPMAALYAGINNDTVESVAPIVPLALAAPTLLDEGAASLRGLHDLHRFRGAAAARRGAGTLLSGFGTYLAGPAIAALAAKGAVAAKRKFQGRDGSEKQARGHMDAATPATPEYFEGGDDPDTKERERRLREVPRTELLSPQGSYPPGYY